MVFGPNRLFSRGSPLEGPGVCIGGVMTRDRQLRSLLFPCTLPQKPATVTEKSSIMVSLGV